MPVVTPTTEPHFNRKQASRYLISIGCPASPNSLRRMAANNNKEKGPPFIRYRHRTVLYRKSDLDEWAAKELVRVE